MPILDPPLQLYLINNYNMDKYSHKDFFIRYLKIASENFKKNLDSVQASLKFKADLMISSSIICKIFGGNYSFERELNNPEIKNYYSYLLDKLSPNLTEKIPINQKGLYFNYRDTYQIRFFQPKINFSKHRAWYFTDSPIAILAINLLNFKKTDNQLIPYFNLEIDLMKASGFTIVLCLFGTLDIELFHEIINNMISTHQFAEIHINFNLYRSSIYQFLSSSNQYYIPEPFDFKIEDFEEQLSNNGFVYFYTLFPNEKVPSKNDKVKNPFFQLIFLSEYINDAFKYNSMGPSFMLSNGASDDPYTYQPFVYCKTGFDQHMIRILLCNVPLYDSENEEIDVIPSLTSGISFAYLSKDDFLSCENFRVRILYDDVSGDHELIEKYVDFDDIHLIRPDFYVKNTLCLTKTDTNTLNKISCIQKVANEKFNENQYEEFKKENIYHLFKSKQIRKGLEYVIYAYQHYVNHSNSHLNFYVHTNQIFTAFEACKICLLNDNKERGVVYQVDTGEGKSCIIQLIAAVLALSKKTVHITSSNINLANRDYYESYNFFQQLHLESAVLLHYNELPYINFQNLPNDNTIYKRENYPRKFFSKKLFKNSSRMNFSVCGIDNNNELTKNKANIVFSTFINFESLYLRIMEMHPSYVHKYFNDCSLLIDEADSILIDELTNGTILSRPMNTNGKEILTFVYKCHKNKIDIKSVFNEVKSLWPECTDLSENDIIEMYKEIDIVNQEEFTNGKKYSIETIYVKEKSKSIKQCVIEMIKAIKDNSFDQIRKIFKEKSISEDLNNVEFTESSDYSDDFSYSDDDEDNKNIMSNSSAVKKKNKEIKTKKYKIIVPFDYEHKGILEPNKEFSGFIQQFIAIKEMFNNEENSNMLIKDISMNYLYVSHPIFVNLYGGVCGLTGTIGNKYDKEILRKHYNLSTKKIPRNAPNRRIDLPILICKTIKERNIKIVNEVYHYHSQEIPILVIFQDLNEIFDVYHALVSKGIKNINICDGKDEKIKPDKISGLKGAVSLGTNVCGRGTDIKNPYKPLHVIVAYYSSNTRVLYQAFGRTGRQGNEGTVRVICLIDQFVSPYHILKDNSIEDALNDFNLKNDLQIKYIEEFREKRKWIFDSHIKSQKLNKEYIKKLRDSRINVNRIKAYNYNFPICMRIQTFITIQAQKIFSLYNCPNCKYTWMLFQQYLRELILETWSLFISQVDKEYFFMNPKKISYKEFLNEKFIDVKGLLQAVIPNSGPQNIFEIIPSFMNIFEFVTTFYEHKVLNSFPKILSSCFSSSDNDRFCSFFIGFKPYTLVDKSGARINSLNGEDQDKYFISDPELKYIMKQPGGFSPILLSITEKIDDIFNKICKRINEVIENYVGLKFFLRRTLCGCEFGLCFDFELENLNENLINNHNCLIDKDPLFVFTINVRSMVPLLAGILIIGLIYITKLAASIAQIISGFNISLASKIIKKTIKTILDQLFQDQIENFCNKICGFLTEVVVNQISFIQQFNNDLALVFSLLLKITAGNDFSHSSEAINKIFDGCSTIKMNLNFTHRFIPTKYTFKIGFLIMLAFASFMLNFQYKRKSLKYKTQKVAEDYNKNQNTDEAVITNGKYVNDI